MSQDKRRRHIRVSDQHDRVYGAVIEIATGHRVGPLAPEGWRSPMPPPDRFIDHTDNFYDVVVNYEAWAGSVKEALDKYEERRRKAASQISAQGTIRQVLEANPPELVDIVGPPPNVPPLIAIQAAKAGNRWILKGEGKPPEAALQHEFFARYRPGYVPPTVNASGAVRLGDEDPFAEQVQVTDAEVYSWDFDRGWVTFPDGSRPRGKESDLLDKLAEEWPDHFANLPKMEPV